MQILIPMSGSGQRFLDAGYAEPKPLVDAGGVPVIERLLQKFPTEWPCTFVLSEAHRSTELENTLRALRPHAQLIYLPPHKEGPGKAVEAALSSLSPQLPVLISYCDYGLKWDPWDFAEFVKKTDCDACLVSYRGFHAHYTSPQTYAYARMEDESVKEVREKGSFTSERENEFASCGAYYFKSISDLKEALENQKQPSLILNGESYTSLTVEALLQKKPQTHCRVYEIDGFYQWGTPSDLENFLYWEKSFSAWNKNKKTIHSQKNTYPGPQVLMPMAGAGSRLSQSLEIPKPFIPIDGIPMYRRALESFPTSQPPTLVALSAHRKFFNGDSRQKVAGEKIKFIESTPAGQALSTELGIASLDPHSPCLVTACDHQAIVDLETYEKFLADPACEAAIFTIKGFPGARTQPLSYSYVQSDENNKVTAVGLKKPFTSHPGTEDLLVGSFWFKTPRVLQHGIDLLKKKAESNLDGSPQELYVDAIFNLLISEKYKIRRIPLAGYINWGDAESLKQALYWYEIYMGRRLELRSPFPGCKA